jgi:hypothetical protein
VNAFPLLTAEMFNPWSVLIARRLDTEASFLKAPSLRDTATAVEAVIEYFGKESLDKTCDFGILEPFQPPKKPDVKPPALCRFVYPSESRWAIALPARLPDWQ